jgi:hypothetical protein
LPGELKYIPTDGKGNMKTCDKCRVDIDCSLNTCPLCQRVIDSCGYDADRLYPKKPGHDRTLWEKNKLIYFVIASITGLCVLLQTMNWTGIPWVLNILAPFIVYTNILGNLRRKDEKASQKILFYFLNLAFLIIMIDLSNGRINWSLVYVVPFMIAVSTILVSIIALRRNKHRNDHIIRQVVFMFLSFLPLTYQLIAHSRTWWPSITSAFLSALIFFLMLTFAAKKFKTEMKKRFYF